MTKKKALIYLIIFVISFWAAAAYRYSVKNNPAQKFPDECKNVMAPQCQQYILKVSAEKKYEEVLAIQQVRIKENEKVLKFYKSKLTDKCLLQMTAKEAEASLTSCINKPKGKRDYFLLKTAEFTVKDILVDSVAVAQIQYNEFQDKKAAVKTLKNAQKVLKQNMYVSGREELFKVVAGMIEELK